MGNYGKGVLNVFNRLSLNGCDVEMKIYENARHELVNETNRREVYNDIADFLQNAGIGSSDWLAIGISRFGFEEDYEAYLTALSQRVKALSDTDNATEWQRCAITASAMGGDPADLEGIDL